MIPEAKAVGFLSSKPARLMLNRLLIKRFFTLAFDRVTLSLLTEIKLRLKPLSIIEGGFGFFRAASSKRSELRVDSIYRGV